MYYPAFAFQIHRSFKYLFAILAIAKAPRNLNKNGSQVDLP